MSSLDFRKPRADDPILPQSALFRKRVIPFKRPKGRRGRKPKGKRVGTSVSYQDPNLILIKAADEARKERELKVRAGERAEVELRQAGERLDILREREAAERVARRREEGARQQNIILLRDQVRLQGAQAREVGRLGGAAVAALRELGGRGEAQAQRQFENQARQADRDQADRARLYAEFRAIYEQGERRSGENQARMDALYREAIERGERHTAGQMRDLDDRQRRKQRPREQRGRGKVEIAPETSESEDIFEGQRFQEVGFSPDVKAQSIARRQREREEVDLPSQQVDLPSPTPERQGERKARRARPPKRGKSAGPDPWAATDVSASEQESFTTALEKTISPEQVSQKEKAAKKLGEQLGRAQERELSQRVIGRDREEIERLKEANIGQSELYRNELNDTLDQLRKYYPKIDTIRQSPEFLERLYENQTAMREGKDRPHKFKGNIDQAKLKDVVLDPTALKRFRDKQEATIEATGELEATLVAQDARVEQTKRTEEEKKEKELYDARQSEYLKGRASGGKNRPPPGISQEQLTERLQEGKSAGQAGFVAEKVGQLESSQVGGAVANVALAAGRYAPVPEPEPAPVSPSLPRGEATLRVPEPEPAPLPKAAFFPGFGSGSPKPKVPKKKLTKEGAAPVKVDREQIAGGEKAPVQEASPYERLQELGLGSGKKAARRLHRDYKKGVDYEEADGEGGVKNPNHPLQTGEEVYPNGHFIITDKSGKGISQATPIKFGERIYADKRYSIHRIDRKDGKLGFTEHRDDAPFASFEEPVDGGRIFGNLDGGILQRRLQSGELELEFVDE